MTRRSCAIYAVGIICAHLLIVGIGLVVAQVFRTLMHNRLKKEIVLVEGSRVFESWKKPPPPVYMEFFFFNVTNAKEFESGAKAQVTQVGPYTYREYRYKDNVSMVENGTKVSAYNTKSFVFLRDKSVGDPAEDSITTVNIPAWAVMNKLKGSFWKASVMAVMMSTVGSGLFTTRTVDELLWGYEDPLLARVSATSPDVDKVFGLMYKKNGSNDGEFIYHTGEQNYMDYGRVETWKGQSQLNFWTSDQSNRINGSDGSAFHPLLEKNERIYIFTPDLCRSIYMEFEKDVEVQGIPAYRFTPPRSVLASKEENEANTGFCVSPKECLGTGLLKVSPCRKGAPVVASFPHFYLAENKYVDAIQGMSPERIHHQTFLDLNPYSAGLAKELILEDTAVPSVYTVGTSSTKIPTRDVACQYSPTQRDVFIQTSRSSVSKTTSTRSKGISCRPAGHSVAVGCSMADFPELMLTSTPIKGKRKSVHLEELSTDTIEPSDPMDSTYQPSFTEISQDNASAPPLYESRKYMVFEENLLQLLRNCPTCMRPCQIDTFEIGTLLSVKQTCSNCVTTNKWHSQPFIRDIPVGNLQLSAAVCFNGASFLQIHKVLSSLRMASICPRTFNHHQSFFLQPTILWQWRAEQQQIIQLAKQSRKPITLGGDMRADSPGHCAKYGSYTTMVLDCNKVVDIQLVQSNEVGNSQRMEREGFERSLHFLESEGLDIGAIVTDRHPSIGKFMREQRPAIRHLYDTWHVAKGLQKRIDGLGKMKGCGDVALWRKSCINHLYWCGASSKTPQEAIAKWTSIVNHMHNVHQHDNELYPKCPHPPLEREWLQPHTKASERLCDILQSPRLLKDIEHLSPQYQSSSIEGFHSLIIQFAPKSKHFPYLGMLCRILLAALHYNENSDRGYSMGPNGEAVVQFRWPKFKKGEFSVHRTRPDPTYNYVNDLQKVLFEEVVVDPGRFQELKDKVDIPENLNAQFPRPDPNQAIALPWSRFAQEEQQ